jgi:hypothetical protein
MSKLHTRLARLEREQPTRGQLTFAEALDRYLALCAWLNERGFADPLAALEAGEIGPEGLEDLLREQAAYDPKRRAWARIEAALAAGELPDDADMRLHCGRTVEAAASSGHCGTQCNS